MKSCKIFWSTQSGRAKACARRTARILREQTTVELHDVGSSFDESSPQPFMETAAANLLSDDHDDTTTFFLMFVSTTGDGEHCDTIKDTWKLLLQKSLPKTIFANKQFAMFCLGDRAYGPQFCAGGRKLAVRLLQLGMSRLCEVGYGDDNTPDGGVFRDLDYWLEEQLLPLLEKRDPADSSLTNHVQPPSPYSLEMKPTNQKDGVPNAEWRTPTFQSSYRDYFTQFCPVSAYSFDDQNRRIEGTAKKQKTAPLLGTIVSNERITTPNWEQDTRHIQISFKNDFEAASLVSTFTTSSLPYQAGDIATILPFNSDEAVDKFLNVLPEETKALADMELTLMIDETAMNNSFTRWPRHCTFRGWLKYCADIHSLPEREDLRALSAYCADLEGAGKDQSEKLQSLSETSEAALYADYVLREKRSWADVLFDFNSLRASGSGLTIPALMVLLPPMRPRDFSIASAPSAILQPTSNEDTSGEANAGAFSLELCVAVVEGKTRLGRLYHGLCSKFLSQLLPEKNSDSSICALQVWIRPGSFGRLPMNLTPDLSKFETPILCIGAGTGVAPMRSLLLERDAVQSAAVGHNGGSQEDAEGRSSDDNILVFGCRKEQSDFYYRNEWDTLVATRRMRLLTAFSRDQFQKIYVQKVLREADDGKLIAQHILERNGAVYIAGGPKMARDVKEDIIEALAKELPGGEKAAATFLNKLQRKGKFSIEAWS